MRHLILILSLLTGATAAHSETDRDLIARVTQGTPIDGQFNRTRKLMDEGEVLVAFVLQNDPNDDEAKNVELNILRTEKPHERMKVNACEIEGGTAEVVSYFFANADADPGVEIGVICKWPEPRLGDCHDLQAVHFFKIPRKFSMKGLVRIENEKFKIFDRLLPNKCAVPDYKDAAGVKKLLKKIGF